MEELTQQEIDERVAILKRFRTLLSQQRDKFREYLDVLEKQQTSISSGSTEALLAHTELEQQVVAGIADIQKVIVPMSEMYASVKGTAAPADIEPLEDIQNDLEKLQNQVLIQNKQNRDLLRVHITQIKAQMQQIRNPYRNARSVYAEKKPVGAFVEVEA